MKFLDYLQDLIRFESTTPESAGSVEYVENLLKTKRFKTYVKTFGESYKVKNLYARFGTGSPNICFAGHLDVVPPGDLSAWKASPFEPLFDGDYIYGRGTVDMKGAVACSLAATLDFLEKHPKPRGSISFLLTTDEEGEAEYGLKAMLPYLTQIGETIDFAILGEPTCEKIMGDKIKIGRRGSINFDLTVKGIQGHAAYPEKAENPVAFLANIVHELGSHKFTKNENGGKSNLVVTSIDTGNETTNVIPGSARAKFNVRFTEAYDPSSIIEIVETIVKKYAKLYDLRHKISALPFIQKKEGYIEKFAKIVRMLTDIDPEFSSDGGTSDARFIKDYAQVVEFGLLSNEAHKTNERVKISDLQSLYNVYYRTLPELVL